MRFRKLYKTQREGLVEYPGNPKFINSGCCNSDEEKYNGPYYYDPSKENEDDICNRT